MPHNSSISSAFAFTYIRPMKKPLFLLITTLVFAIACNKGPVHVIPDVPVNIYIYPNDPLFFDLQAVGGWVYVSGGYRGILVYRKTFDEFVAYDRACPSAPDGSCRATVELNNITLLCDCDSTRYQLYDGFQVSGPGGGIPLKTYRTTFDGNALHIYN
jgi:nitrite reductase/ring-hydroxylating ferredoxin subunit